MVNWAAMGQVLLFALVAGAVLVAAFSVGLVCLDRYQLSRQAPHATNQAATAALVFAVLCFAVCLIGVGLGLWAMLSK